LQEPVKVHAEQIFRELASQEGANPATVAKLVAHMKPPLESTATSMPGFYELSVPGLGNEAPVNYYVQLPPEYDPYRRYPAIVTLHGAGTTPQIQIDWWAGAPQHDGTRMGQAARYGYIVIAPHWGREHQRE